MRTYHSIETEFRRHFGEGSNFSWCDFRPHFDGNLINASLAIPPSHTVEDTEGIAWSEFRRIWMWLRDWEPYFDDGDRLQVVVGFNAEVKPSGGRQIFKGSLAVKDLSKLSERFSPEIFIQAGGECRLLVNWAALSKSIP